MKPSISINVITYGIPEFMEYMLGSLRKAGVPENVPVRLFEDKCLDPMKADEVSAQYKAVCVKYDVEYYRTPIWGCCQGAAQYAVMNSKEDWIILLGDDILVKKGAPASWIDRIINRYDVSSAGLIGVSWWEALTLVRQGRIKDKKEILQGGFVDNFEDNPSWEKPENLYINVHGSGFIMRRKMWEEVGGFSQNTWVWDEDISFRCWMFSRYNIFTAPGPSIMHYGGKAANAVQRSLAVSKNPRDKIMHGTFGNSEAWVKSWGYAKAVTSPLLYMAMSEARKNGITIDKCALRNKPMADKIKDWKVGAELYEKMKGDWFIHNDVETLGV